MVVTKLKPANKKLKTFKAIQEPKLKMKEKISYGFGDLGNGMMFDMGQIYLLKFLTDVLGISSVYAGLVFLVSKIFDAFVDVGVGSYIDNQKNYSKKGKFRPFIIYGSLPLAIMTVVTFLTPNFSETGKIIWAFAAYMAFNAAYSVVNIPYGSLSASMTLNADDRTQLSVFRNMGSQGALFLAGVSVIPIVSLFPNEAVGYPIAVAVLAIFGMVFHVICYKGVKERHVVERPDVKGLGKKAFLSLFKNVPFIVLVIYTLLTITAQFLKLNVQLFYFDYVLGQEGLVGVVSTLNVIVVIPAVILTTYISKRVGKKMTAIIGTAGFSICELLNFTLFGGEVIPFLIVNTIGSMFLVIPTTVSWAFIADVVDYGQWQSGLRSEGIIYSSYSFTRKLSQALAGFLPGLALAMVGFKSNVEQTASTIVGMKFVFFGFPLIITILGLFIFLIFYPLTDKRHNQIVKELALREEL
ncbi:MFS transporter [Staphylococcus arlettae]|uniref:MFS transporter n=1 Tax=Staphylococcus arlettae TaxID=29378 RepID=UPI000E696B7B|nr:MFS transporter [Staphylococcus arlettae]RIM67655.1 MFS transporter [Staphylococcus arlettae]